MIVETAEVEVPQELLRALRTAQHVVALTGAGISAESGVPTFQGQDNGLWADVRPEEVASPEGFAADPVRAWEWYAWRRAMVNGAEPNAGHRALALLEQRVPRFTLITQNVDGLHQRAGSTAVIELHGSLATDRCLPAGHRFPGNAAPPEMPPRCPECGGLLRPDVVWFGELIPEDELEAALSASLEADLLLSIGTAGLVYPANALPLQALQVGVPVVEVNPRETPLSELATWRLEGPAAEILPALVEAL